MRVSNSRACPATLCSQSSSYLFATVWLIELKSRLPREAAYPIAAKAMPIRMPISNAPGSSTSGLVCGCRNHRMNVTIRPVDSPLCRPCTMTVPQLRRPVTRSTDFRSVPTIARFSTANF